MTDRPATDAAIMKHGTAIEWTHFPGYRGETWNPTLGCSKVSAGCAGCYAIPVSHIRAGNKNPKIHDAFAGLVTPDGRNWTGEVRVMEDRLDRPDRWRLPRSVFVNSLSDLFHENFEWTDINRVLEVMSDARDHRFLVLTKRPGRMSELLNEESAAWREWMTRTDLDVLGDEHRIIDGHVGRDHEGPPARHAPGRKEAGRSGAL